MKISLRKENWRFWLVAALFAVLPLFLIYRSTNLLLETNVQEGEFNLKQAGEDRTVRPEPLVAYRGVITDRNGELLAVSTPVKSIYLDPFLLKKSEIPAIAKAVGMPVSELRQKLKLYENKRWMYLAQQLPPYEADRILAFGLSGVAAETVYKRFYPAGEVISHVVGLTNIDDRGMEGVELAYDTWLRGEEGKKKVLVDRKQNVVKELGLIKAPVPGQDLQLTIDLKLQYIAYRELKESILNQGAKSGSMVLLDARSGEVLAIVNHPSYNPNDRAQMKVAQMRNRSLTDVFEPGSTVKPFTIAAALESGKYRKNDHINVSPGYIRVGHKTILDPVNYKDLDLTGIIRKSSQVGITKIALTLEPDQIRDMFFRVGLGQVSGMGFPGEQSGAFPNRAKWTDIERATFAFGYGLSVNALQLSQGYLTLANQGVYKPVTLIRGNAHREGQRVMDLEIARQLVDMLKTVTESGGTATGAHLSSYPVAGKTGTSHKLDEGGGYADDKYVAIFAGFAPADNPRVVAVVVVNEPPSSGEYSGGKAAAPIFGRVIDKVLRAMNTAPENREEFLSLRAMQEAGPG